MIQLAGGQLTIDALNNKLGLPTLTDYTFDLKIVCYVWISFTDPNMRNVEAFIGNDDGIELYYYYESEVE